LKLKPLQRLLEKVKPKRVLLFLHHNADPDALFSARVLAKLLRKIKPGLKVQIVAVEGPSALSRLLMDRVPVQLEESPKLEKAGAVFLVDTSTLEQLGEWKKPLEEAGKPLAIIDHHMVHPDTEKRASLLLVDPESRSTAEIVYRLCREAKLKLDRKDALGLLFALIHETRGFRYASAETFKVASELASLGARPEEAFQLSAEPPSRSEKIARIKAASRAELHEAGEWLIAVSHVGSFQASAARALLSLGFDLAIVGGEAEGEIRVSLRSTPAFQEKTGIHLGRDIAMKVGEKFGGMGGGHASSAGINCRGELEEVLNECLRLVKSLLNVDE